MGKGNLGWMPSGRTQRSALPQRWFQNLTAAFEDGRGSADPQSLPRSPPGGTSRPQTPTLVDQPCLVATSRRACWGAGEQFPRERAGFESEADIAKGLRHRPCCCVPIGIVSYIRKVRCGGAGGFQPRMAGAFHPSRTRTHVRQPGSANRVAVSCPNWQRARSPGVDEGGVPESDDHAATAHFSLRRQP
jgi:hypothetical protein